MRDEKPKIRWYDSSLKGTLTIALLYVLLVLVVVWRGHLTPREIFLSYVMFPVGGVVALFGCSVAFLRFMAWRDRQK